MQPIRRYCAKLLHDHRVEPRGDPGGHEGLYYGPVANNPNFSSNNVLLDDGAGNTAMGNCIVDFGAGPKGMCAFYAGSGTLEGFTAVVHVTMDADNLWHWDGGYTLDPR